MNERKRILIIDDDEILAEITCKKLVKRGFDVSIANLGKEGLARAQSDEFDLVLLDIQMPDIQGTEVLTCLRQQLEKNVLPVIMISACEGQKEIVDAMKLGANDYVVKPIDIDILIARIETQLEIKLLALEFTAKKQLEAVNAMITTYNHEINNPLAIAFGVLSLTKTRGTIPQKQMERLEDSLLRIKTIVEKISTVSEKQQLEYTNYGRAEKMVKLT